MKKYSFIFFLSLLSWMLAAQQVPEISRETLLKELLLNNREYQQIHTRYKREKASAQIENSLSWFDMNFAYQSWNNDIQRDQT